MNIKEAGMMSGVSADMIRYYEKKGLLCPKRNPENKYRDYTMSDIYTLVSIKKYSTMGIPLNKIKELFAYEHADEAAEYLCEIRKELEEERKRIYDRIEYAKYNESLFRQIGAQIEGEFTYRESFYFYPNSEDVNRAAVHVKNGVFHPVFRIRDDKEGRTILRGMTFVERIPEGMYEKYEKTPIYRVIAHLKNEEDLKNLDFQEKRKILRENGYVTEGDIFGYKVMDRKENGTEIVVLEFPLHPVGPESVS